MGKIKRFFLRWKQSRDGVSSIEFAIVMPMLILMLTGAFETGRFLMIHQKADKVAYAIGDLVSQQTSVSRGTLKSAVDLIPEIMNPFTNDAQQRILISSFERTAGATQKRWDYSSGGGMSGGAVTAADVNTQMRMRDDENIIVTEMTFNFEPVFLANIFPPQEVYKISYFRPRYGSLTVLQP